MVIHSLTTIKNQMDMADTVMEALRVGTTIVFTMQNMLAMIITGHLTQLTITTLIQMPILLMMEDTLTPQPELTLGHITQILQLQFLTPPVFIQVEQVARVARVEQQEQEERAEQAEQVAQVAQAVQGVRGARVEQAAQEAREQLVKEAAQVAEVLFS